MVEAAEDAEEAGGRDDRYKPLATFYRDWANALLLLEDAERAEEAGMKVFDECDRLLPKQE